MHDGYIRLFSFCMLVVDAMGEHMVEAYSSMGLVMALYIASMVLMFAPLGRGEDFENG